MLDLVNALIPKGLVHEINMSFEQFYSEFLLFKKNKKKCSFYLYFLVFSVSQQ
jgi:hypothetical protein